MTKPVFSLRLLPELVEVLDRLASEYGQTRSQCIETILLADKQVQSEIIKPNRTAMFMEKRG